MPSIIYVVLYLYFQNICLLQNLKSIMKPSGYISNWKISFRVRQCSLDGNIKYESSRSFQRKFYLESKREMFSWPFPKEAKRWNFLFLSWEFSLQSQVGKWQSWNVDESTPSFSGGGGGGGGGGRWWPGVVWCGVVWWLQGWTAVWKIPVEISPRWRQSWVTGWDR